jgi:protein involved in polysaccharide export with SLBB domain
MVGRLIAAAALAHGLLACTIEPLVPMPMPAPIGAPASSAAYLLAPGDAIDIKFFYNPELNESLAVRPDGFVTLQLVGDVQASGRSPGELAAELRSTFASRIPHPEISVMVREYASQAVFVMGEVTNPGLVPLRGPMTSLQALVVTGGAKNTARLGQVVLIRYVGTDQATIERVDLSDVLAGKASDVLLRPYDVIFVPMTPIAQLNVLVDQYINKMVPTSMSFPYSINTTYKVIQ